ncbi:MAG: transposase [Desulfobacterales bacterium]
MSKKCRKNDHRFCPRCLQRKNYRLKDGRRRCSRCKYTFHDFSGRWINAGRITCSQWLSLIRLFEQELPARQAADKVGLSYNTVYGALNTLRYAILAHAEDAPAYFCRKTGYVKCCYGGNRSCDTRRCLIEDVPVFGIQHVGNQVQVRLVPDVTPGNLIRSEVKKIRRGSIIYTDRYKAYDGMLYYGYHHARVMSDDCFPEDYVFMNRINGFWTWSRDRFVKYYGVSSINFPLYLKELEFRYNHREQDIFEILSQYVCDLIPDFKEEEYLQSA